MSQLKRDIASFRTAIRVVSWFFVGLGVLRGLQFCLGLTEREFYRLYPAGRYVSVALGLGFIISLLYSVKKVYEMHPKIQLRSKPTEVLESVLADPDYAMWHQEAKRLIDKRKS